MQLTVKEEVELKYMQLMGYKWIAKYSDEQRVRVYAYIEKPYKLRFENCKKSVYVSSKIGNRTCCNVGEYEFLNDENSLMEIDKLLRDNGKNIELIEPSEQDISLL